MSFKKEKQKEKKRQIKELKYLQDYHKILLEEYNKKFRQDYLELIQQNALNIERVRMKLKKLKIEHI
jgi:hypothetical protein